MRLEMKRTTHRRGIFASIQYVPMGTVLDLDFDNDNAKPITSESLTRLLRRN